MIAIFMKAMSSIAAGTRSFSPEFPEMNARLLPEMPGNQRE